MGSTTSNGQGAPMFRPPSSDGGGYGNRPTYSPYSFESIQDMFTPGSGGGFFTPIDRTLPPDIPLPPMPARPSRYEDRPPPGFAVAPGGRRFAADAPYAAVASRLPNIDPYTGRRFSNVGWDGNPIDQRGR